METQYVTDKHLWWKDAVRNLQSAYSDYILFDDAAHNIPATMVADLRALNSYDGSVINITTVNLQAMPCCSIIKTYLSFLLTQIMTVNLMMV